MGDVSAEPSMEEILSSIKRIIAEEGDPPGRARRGSAARPVPSPVPEPDEPEVLELDTPVAPPPRVTEPPRQVVPEPPRQPTPELPRQSAPDPVRHSAPPADEPPAQPIVSREAAQATRGSLDVLSRLVTRPEPNSDGTLEGLVRDMLRPMLREWLDANLPPMVEQMVSREIAKITGQAG